jgi:hypothetical protein
MVCFFNAYVFLCVSIYRLVCTSVAPPECVDGFYSCLIFKSLSSIDRFMVNMDTNFEIEPF